MLARLFDKLNVPIRIILVILLLLLHFMNILGMPMIESLCKYLILILACVFVPMGTIVVVITLLAQWEERKK